MSGTRPRPAGRYQIGRTAEAGRQADRALGRARRRAAGRSRGGRPGCRRAPSASLRSVPGSPIRAGIGGRAWFGCTANRPPDAARSSGPTADLVATGGREECCSAPVGERRTRTSPGVGLARRQLDLGRPPRPGAPRGARPWSRPNQLSRLVIMIGKAVWSGRSLLSRSTVSTTTLPSFPVGPVEHRVERVAGRPTRPAPARRPCRVSLRASGISDVVEPDVGHQRRVPVLLGDDRVVERLAKLPERRRSGPGSITRTWPGGKRVGNLAMIDHDGQPVAAPADAGGRSGSASGRPSCGLDDFQVDQRDRLEHLFEEQVARRDQRAPCWRSRRGRIAQAVLSAGRASSRSIGRGAGRRRPRSSRRPGSLCSPGSSSSGTTSIGSSSRSSSRRQSAGLVRGVGDLDQDLVADRVEQAAPGLEPGDPDVAASSCRPRSSSTSVLPGELGRALESAVGQRRRPGASCASPTAAVGPASPRRRPGSGRRSGRSHRGPRGGSAGGRSGRRRPGAGSPAAMIAISSPSRMPSISRRPSALAASSRVGDHIGGVHARRVVHHQHEPARPGLLPAEDRVGQGEHQEGQEGQLQQQREQVPQPLPERPRLLLLEDLLPEQERRDRHPPQADLEDVEDHDRHRQCRPASSAVGLTRFMPAPPPPASS